MAKKELPAGYNSWKDYYDYVVAELAKFDKRPVHGTDDYDRYWQLQHDEITAKYAWEDEKKAAKKAALEAQAAENGIGPKEQKIANTMDRARNSIEKWKINGEKAVKKGIISSELYEGALKWCELTVSAVDEVWETIKDENNDSSRFIRKNLSIVTNTEHGYYELRDFIGNSKSWDLYNVKPDIENAVGSYVDNLFKRAEARVMDTRIANRVKAKDDKEKHYQTIRRAFYGPIETGKVPTMKVFLDNWISNYVKYYTDEEKKEHFKSVYEEAQKKYNDYVSSNRRYSNEYYVLQEEQTRAWQNYYPFTKTPEEIQRDAEISADNMERKFISTVYDYSGEIEEVSLRFGIGGDLNGVVTGKDGRKWRVETITAGGYNIQCFHLRTIVHEIKGA